VIAGNPELGEALDDSDIAPATWRLTTLAMSKPDGGRLDIELLRPVEWIDHVSADVGRTVELVQRAARQHPCAPPPRDDSPSECGL
jgi:hypothetical protein